MKILILSAYDAASHRYWHQGLVSSFTEHQWRVLSLPARYFNWRVRGNSMSWAYLETAALEEDYDLVIATSMVDLSTLRGLVPKLARWPTIVYFHENQFAYPQQGSAQPRLEPVMVNMYTALCADCLLFNSEYNRASFLQGATELLNKMPDFVPPAVLEKLNRSQVLPVPLSDTLFDTNRGADVKAAGASLKADKALHIVWNHRWEYDKGPDRLLLAMSSLVEAGVRFDLSLLGQQFRRCPPAFEQLKALLGGAANASIRHWGYIEDTTQYLHVLQQADCVVSTSLHDFQGLSVLEAAALGSSPLVPDRLAYCELFAEPFRYLSKPDEPALEAQALAARLQQLAEFKCRGEALPTVDLSPLSRAALKCRYQAVFEAVVAEMDAQ